MGSCSSGNPMLNPQLNLRVVPARSPGALRRAAWPGQWCSGAAFLNLISTQTFKNNQQGSLCAPKCSHIYDSSNVWGKTQPKDLIEKLLLSLRKVIFIKITLFQLLRILKLLRRQQISLILISELKRPGMLAILSSKWRHWGPKRTKQTGS